MVQPNILFIVLDTARADTVKSMMTAGELSGIQKFAENGTYFNNAFANSPWTLPSHASMFTGQRASVHKTHAGNKKFDPKVPSLPELLSSNEYRTLGISGNSWISDEFGFDKGFDNLSTKWDRFWGGADLSAIAKAEGFNKIETTAKILLNRQAPTTIANIVYERVLSNRTDFGTARTTDRTIDWLRSYSDTRPFFYFINYLEPHLPYKPPEEFKERYTNGDNRTEVNQNPWEYVAGTVDMTDSDFEILDSLYRAEIAYLDSHLDRIYNTLQEEDLLSSTAVIIAGDHGENIGDHELMDHQYSLHDTLLHVPLIIRYPQEIEPGQNGNLLELRDLYPTVASIAELDIPNDDTVSTNDLTDDNPRESVFAEYRYPQPDMKALQKSVTDLEEDYMKFDQTLRSIRTENWKLIEKERGEKLLYQTVTEKKDVSESHPDIISELQEKMDVENIAISRGEETNVQVSKETEQRLEDLGYV